MSLDKVLFIAAPLVSAVLILLLNRKYDHDREHQLHTLSVSYMTVLALAEIDVVIGRSGSNRAFVFMGLFVLLLLAWELYRNKPSWNFLSHHHHTEFSYSLGLLFIFHALTDTVIFTEAAGLKSGLIVHRLVDGFALFGLLGFKKERVKVNFKSIGVFKILLIVLFLLTPILGLSFLNTNSSLFILIKNICLFMLVILAVLDLQLELRNRQHSWRAVMYAMLIGVFIATAVAIFNH